MVTANAPNLNRLSLFNQAFTGLLDAAPTEDVILSAGGRLLADLVSQDDWLPDALARHDANSYRQYLLHCDPLERFSVVSFVWGPGQKTPVHNHTVWGLVGMLRGEEIAQDFVLADSGALVAGERRTLHPGQVTAVSPVIGDIHTVENALLDRASISVHVYGANIGKVVRATFDRQTGEARTFISGYSEVVA